MKRMVWITAIVCLLCIGASAFGQNLAVFRKLGKLTPHVESSGRTPDRCLLIYKTRGIMFYVLSEYKTTSVLPSVFEAAGTPGAGELGSDSVVPGVGARGVRLGMTMEHVKANEFWRRASGKSMDGSYAYCRADDGKALGMFLSDGSVTQLDVFGAFSTPEGVSESSTMDQILQIYGTPDVYYDIEQRRSLRWLPLAFMVMPMLGLATGLTIRCVRRRARGSGAGLVVVGGFGCVIAVVVSRIGFGAATGIQDNASLFASAMIRGLLTGAGCVLAVQLLSTRLRGCLGWLAAFFAAIAVAYAADALVDLASPVGEVIRPLCSVPAFTGPFVVFMLAGAGMKRDMPPTTGHQAETDSE